MKTFTGVLVVALGLAAPLHAQTATPAEPAATASTEAAAKPAEANPAETKPVQVKKAEKPKKARAAAAKTTAGQAAVNFDGTAAAGEPKEKKAGTARHSGTVPVEKVGGKTCSGRDEYRVCW